MTRHLQVAGEGMPRDITREAWSLERLSPDETANVLRSIEAMGHAQLHRFPGATGVVSIIFDSNGASMMAIARPDQGGVTDEYVAGALLQASGAEPQRKRKR